MFVALILITAILGPIATKAMDFGQINPIDDFQLLKEAQEQARFLNLSSTGTNVTSMATLTGAILFIILNTVFLWLYVDPFAGGESRKDKEKTDKSTNGDDYYYYDDELNVVKR